MVKKTNNGVATPTHLPILKQSATKTKRNKSQLNKRWREIENVIKEDLPNIQTFQQVIDRLRQDNQLAKAKQLVIAVNQKRLESQSACAKSYHNLLTNILASSSLLEALKQRPEMVEQIVIDLAAELENMAGHIMAIRKTHRDLSLQLAQLRASHEILEKRSMEAEMQAGVKIFKLKNDTYTRLHLQHKLYTEGDAPNPFIGPRSKNFVFAPPEPKRKKSNAS
jgi:hypothetical protein